MVLPTEKYFFVHNGPACGDLSELMQAIKQMSDDSFYHHVTPDKNDFATWINDCFGEHLLARRLGRLKARADILKTLFTRIYA